MRRLSGEEISNLFSTLTGLKITRETKKKSSPPTLVLEPSEERG